MDALSCPAQFGLRLRFAGLRDDWREILEIERLRKQMKCDAIIPRFLIIVVGGRHRDDTL